MPATTSPHQALYRRWRAQRFSEIVGQQAVVETLRNAVRLGRLSHGFLFVGPRGTGKTSMARILAKAVNCTDLHDGEPCDACPSCVAIREGRALDVTELDAASNNKVDDMRELLPRVYTAPSDLRRKVFIIDEVQRIREGWDVLLKTLEEPPDDVLFIFCTTNPAQIRPAVVSRLQRFAFRPLTVDEIRGKLERILAEEGRAADAEAVTLVAQLAAGGMRDAESMLDQLLNSGSERLTAASVRSLLGLAEATATDGFIEALAAGDALAGIAVLDALEAEGRDLAAFADQVVARLREVVVARLSGQPGGSPAIDRLAPAELAALARRVTGLDANRSSPGGFRFQLELLLLQGGAIAPRPEPVAVIEALAARRPKAPATSPQTIATPATPAPPPAEESPARGASTRRPQPAASGPAASTPEAPTDDREALERLRGAWPEFVEAVGHSPALRPLIAVCRPVEVAAGIVVLGFPEDRPFYRDKAEQRRTALEAGLEQVLGRAYGVRCVTTNLEALEPLPADAEGEALVSKFREVFAGDLADVAEIS